jgi:Ca2+-binding EF-hand superfamily protein
MQLSDVTYSEVVHISLEEFETDFVPLSLADCLPDGSEHLYTGLVESEEFPQGSVEVKSEGTESEVDPSEFDAETSKMRNERTQVHLDTSELSGSFASTMDRRKPPTLTDVASNFSPRQKESPQSMQTPQHALNRIATEMVMGWGGKDAVRRLSGSSETLAFPPSPAPRLLGKDRRITKVSSMPWIKSCKPVSTSLQSSPIFATHGHVTLTGGLQFVHALQYLNTFVPYSCKTLDGKLTGRSFTTSLLQPGTYSYITGVPEKDEFRSLEIVLHADGSCKYHEIVNGSTMRSTCGATVWRVDKTMLIVDTKKASAHGLSLREARGTRTVERRVRSIKIPTRVIQQYCTYEPFAQQQVPFPGHNPVDESERIFGLIDPNSPVLRSMKCRPDRLPYLAFEQELRRHGLPCDNIVSDFHFLDRDEDGQISVRDMRGLETYGNPVAAPEVIDELREALLTRFGGLDSAFDALVGDAGAGCVDFDDFEAFLVTSAEDSPGKRVAGSSQKIKEWVTNTNVEDRKAVFASLNPNHDHGIDLTDFMSLNLHAAVVALRRLEHFQGWISEQFGQSAEAYVHIFRAIDKEQSQLLSRKVFAEGLLRLGYPCSVWASSIFALLDLNFSGELSVNNFKKLCDFNAAKMLMSLQDLKMVVDEKFKGVSECFQWLLQREMILQGASRLPRTVSFKTFHAMCRKVKFAPGLGSKRPDMNLRMLFLFLDVASGKPRSDGFLTKNEWSLLMGLNSRSLAGSPARLRRILEQKYGGMDQAFETMHTAWLERALPRGLRHTALTRLARVLLTAISSPSSHHSASPKFRKSKCNFLPSVRAPSGVPQQSKVGRLSTSVSLPELGVQHLQSAGGKVARARH